MRKYYKVKIKSKKYKTLNDFFLFENFDAFISTIKKIDFEVWECDIVLSENINLDDYLEYYNIKNSTEYKDYPEYLTTVKELENYLKERGDCA